MEAVAYVLKTDYPPFAGYFSLALACFEDLSDCFDFEFSAVEFAG
jgi:hypothetical protein